MVKILLQIRAKNFKSFYNDVVFSMIADDSNDEHSNYLIKNKNEFDQRIKTILPFASIYGANGAGKTNVLKIISYASELVKGSRIMEPGDSLPYHPHALSKESPTEIEISFIINGNRYAYGFSLNDKEILTEYLYHFPKGRQAKIFERSNSSYSYGRPYRDLSEMEDRTIQNKLFLSAAASWTKNKEIEEAFLFFKEKLVINIEISRPDWFDKSIDNLPNYKDELIKFLSSIGQGVTDISATKKKISINREELPLDMPDLFKDIISSSEGELIEVVLNYMSDNGSFLLSLKEESYGIQKIVEIFGPIIEAINDEKVLVIDELERSLHPLLVRELVKLFTNGEIKSQLIFTTHESSLLDLELFRRDQIYFVNKTREYLSSEIYSLSEIKDVRKNENILKGYIKGKYGAIPTVFSKIVKETLPYDC